MLTLATFVAKRTISPVEIEARKSLRDELLAALNDDPTVEVRTPGWGHVADALEVVADHLYHPNAFRLLMKIVTSAAAGEDVKIAADRWLSVLATQHGIKHGEELAESMAATRFCSNCNGSGEGMREGSRCAVCHGRGEA